LQNEIHGLILLADDQAPRMMAAVEQIKASLANVATVVHEDQGTVFRNEKGQGIEHFGFVDGTSQPLFLKHDIEEASQYGLNYYDTTAPAGAVLTPDPNGRDQNSFGSYLVYRKLEQDVHGFRRREQELANTLGIDPELAGAYVIGRFRDGTPVIHSELPLGETAPVNDFDYHDDFDGAKCPFHAHIRKANPRGAVAYGGDESLEDERQHRIARRGIPYGPLELFPTADEKVGLLFMCYQSDIGRQFEYMQGVWSNAGDFVRQGSGIDALIGQSNTSNGLDGQNWPSRWGNTSQHVRFHFANFITMRGGEYFFAPSISFLTSI
jgi:Dyp-type peroxidase family